MNSINNMSENKTEVKARIMPAEDGSIKVVVFSAPKSPPLLGAKAVRVRLSQISNLLLPISLADRRAAPRTHLDRAKAMFAAHKPSADASP